MLYIHIVSVFWLSLWTIFEWEKKVRGSREPFIVSVQFVSSIFVLLLLHFNFIPSLPFSVSSQNAYCHVLSRIVQSVQCSRAHWHKQTNEQTNEYILSWSGYHWKWRSQLTLTLHTHSFPSYFPHRLLRKLWAYLILSLPLPLSFFPDSIYLFYLLECFSIQFLTSFHLTRSELNSFFAHIRTHYTLPAHTHTHTLAVWNRETSVLLPNMVRV